MTDLFERRSLPEIVDAVMSKLGGIAEIADVLRGVRRTATKDEWEQHADAAITNSIRSALRRRDENNLPEHLEVGGVYKAMRLFSPEDYETKARYYAKSSRANKDMIFTLRDACEQSHGKTFDAEAICREYGVAS